jgi:hypothetical protein
MTPEPKSRRQVASSHLVLALLLAFGSTGCAHKQMTNRQVAKAAVYGGAVVVFLAVAVAYCHTSCTTQ